MLDTGATFRHAAAVRRQASNQPRAIDDHDRMWAALTAADPTFAERYEADQHHQVAEMKAFEPVLDDLSRSGISLTSVRELQSPGAPVEAATPVLLRWMPVIDQRDAKRRLIQILGDPRAGEYAARALIAEYRRVAPHDDGNPIASIRANIGSALSVHDCDPIADDLLAIAADRSHGLHRGMIVHDLSRLRARRADAIMLLRSLLDEPAMRSVSVQALTRLRATETRTDA